MPLHYPVQPALLSMCYGGVNIYKQVKSGAKNLSAYIFNSSIGIYNYFIHSTICIIRYRSQLN